ncbi:NAD(P)-binding protein, partial [Rhodococcus wratislaviensis]
MVRSAIPVELPVDSVGRAPERVEVLIVGAGFGGLGTAIRLKQDGIEDFVVLDRADDIGGT